MKVNAFIVGAPKAGTTSLHFYLSKHQNVSMSAIKEPNFFSSKEVTSLYYRSKYIDNSNEYHRLFSENKKVIGEASVSYLFYEEVPKRIFDYNPEAKIIIMLRNPVERALSHYLMDCRLGYCHESLENILLNRDQFPQFFQQFFELGLYHSQVENYISVFGKEKIKIIFYDDFKTDTQVVMNELADFLDIEKFNSDYSVQNPFLSPSSPFISYLYKFRWIRKSIKVLLSKKRLEQVKRVFFMQNDKPNFSQELKSKIRAYYLSDIYKLEHLLEVDLNRWKKE